MKEPAAVTELPATPSVLVSLDFSGHTKLAMVSSGWSLRSHKPRSEPAEAQSLLEELAGIFREDCPRPFRGLVLFGGCAVYIIPLALRVSAIPVTSGSKERMNVAVYRAKAR